MDAKWFKEDRDAARAGEGQEQALKAESIKALKNSTLMQRRLSGILIAMLAETERNDEDFSKPNWEREHVANISRRKTLREVFQLIQFK